MSTHTPIFCRKVDGNKVVVITILPQDEIGITDNDADDTFFLAETTSNPYTGMNSAITLMRETKMSSEEYVNGLNNTGMDIEHTVGMGIAHILRSSFWFIKKVKTLFDQM